MKFPAMCAWCARAEGQSRAGVCRHRAALGCLLKEWGAALGCWWPWGGCLCWCLVLCLYSVKRLRGNKSVVILRKHWLCVMGVSSSRAWEGTKSPWEGWAGSFGVPGRDTPEMRAQDGAAVWVWQVCYEVGWDVRQKEQRRFEFEL